MSTIPPFLLDRYFKLRGEDYTHQQALDKARAYAKELLGLK